MPDDLVFVTNGSITESSTYGDNTPAPPTKKSVVVGRYGVILPNRALSLVVPKSSIIVYQTKVGLYQQPRRQIT